MTKHPSPRRGTSPHAPSPRGLAALAVSLTMILVLGGCFVLREGRTYAIGAERNRVNVVIFQRPTAGLHDFGRSKGSTAARRLIISQVPRKFPISLRQRALICAVSWSLCLSADRIGRTVASWFRADIRGRSDFWPALSRASRHRRCFAWTFIPSRNLTDKGRGTAGCRAG